ncbi:hypothetical protein [Kitasatospora sp. NPDC088779]|uniref:hypothetical protein n=1 Tax=unclassified Kitasatospora TaxID=2633591 RepID=UPI003444F122
MPVDGGLGGLGDAVAALAQQAALVAGPELMPDTPSELLPFGLSAAYWLDLRAYDPVATATALAGPMLILQGGRDYQVTVADDLTRWQAALRFRTRTFDRSGCSTVFRAPRTYRVRRRRALAGRRGGPSGPTVVSVEQEAPSPLVCLGVGNSEASPTVTRR